MRPEAPVKLWYRIGEVARIVDVEPHVLRYWETEFRSIRPQKSAKGQRVYSRKDVDTLLKVKDLLYAHRFTIEGARRKLREGGVEPLSLPPQPLAVQPALARAENDSVSVSLGNPVGVPQTPPFSLGNPVGVPQTPPLSLGNLPQTLPIADRRSLDAETAMNVRMRTALVSLRSEIMAALNDLDSL